MGRKALKLKIEMNLTDAVNLAEFLSRIKGKGQIDGTPAWARKIVGIIADAVREQFEE